MVQKVAVVTGSNKGIGYAVVKGLTPLFDGHVYVTARNPELGQKALESLKQEVGPGHADKLRFHQLDITNEDSVSAFKDHIMKEYGGVDVLVNNAAVSTIGSKEPFAAQVEVSCDTNFFGTLRISKALIPNIRENGRVVNVASRVGLLSCGAGPKLRKRLTDPDLDLEKLSEIVREFMKLAKEGKHVEEDFPDSALAFSKMVHIALNNVQQALVDQHFPNKNVLVNACCPGYVNTDFNSHAGHKSPEEGADTIIYLATLPVGAEGPKAQFLYERKPLSWETDTATW